MNGWLCHYRQKRKNSTHRRRCKEGNDRVLGRGGMHTVVKPIRYMSFLVSKVYVQTAKFLAWAELAAELV